MSMRTAYTALLAQFPPLAVGIVAALAGFLGAGLAAVRLSRFGAAAESFDSGARWGGTVGAAAAIAVGVATLVLLRRGEAGPGVRLRAAAAVALAGPAGWVSALAGSALGAVLGGGRPPEGLLTAAATTGLVAWPVLACAAAMGVAIGATATER